MSLRELATNAMQHKKPTKREAQQIIKNIVARHELTSRMRDELAQLYRYFMPAPVAATKAKTAFAWVAAACGNDATRPYLYYVHITEKWIEATDGHRVHRARNTEGFEPGYYWQNGDPLDMSDRYPDIDRVMLSPRSFPHTAPLNEALTDDYKEIKRDVARAVRVGDLPAKWLPVDQLKAATAPAPEDATVRSGERHAPIQFEFTAYDRECVAIVMPYRD